jgi:hypothetical protein
MTERAGFDARKESESYRRTEPPYSQRWPEGAPWPDSSEHRQALLPVLPLPLPQTRPDSLENPLRGTVFGLAVIPFSVGLWLVLWKLRRLPSRSGRSGRG